MPKFSYTAIDSASGAEKTGSIESSSAEQAAIDLKMRGLFPTGMTAEAGAAAAKNPSRAAGKVGLSLAKAGSGKGARGGQAATPKVAAGLGAAESAIKKKRRPITIGRLVNRAGLTVFSRQLATLVNAGMPILRSLETLSRQERNVAFKAVIDSVAETIRSGGTFSDGLLQHPKVFDRLYVNMVKSGEASGVLGTVLDRLAKFMEKAERIKGKVKSAMTYPLIITIVAVGIVGALMVFVVPKFEQIFAGLLKGQALPPLTLVVLGVSNFIKHNIIATLAIIVAAYVGLVLLRRTKRGTYWGDWLMLKLPVMGPLFLKAAVSRFTRTFGTLLASGVPILQAITITRDTAGNVLVAEALDVVHDRVKEGDTVARPLDSTRIFPGMVTSMIEVGEETGALPEMLNRIADGYDEEVDNAVAGLTSIIEPIMIVLMAVMVGTIVIALFMPIIKIIQSLS